MHAFADGGGNNLKRKVNFIAFTSLQPNPEESYFRNGRYRSFNMACLIAVHKSFQLY